MVQGRSQHSSPLPSSLAPFQFWHRTTGLGPTPSSACEACNFLSIPALHVLIAELPAETKPLPWTPLVGKCSDTADRDSAVHFITLIVFPSSHRCRCRSAKLSGPMRPANRLACVAAALLLLAIAGAKASDIKDPRAGSDRAPLKVDRWVRGVQRF